MILKVTSFNEQFNKLVKMTLSERQHVNNQTDGDGSLQVVDESAKSQDFFQNNHPLGKKIHNYLN